MEPINYTGGFADPMESFKNALAFGAVVQNSQLNALKLEAAQTEAQRQANTAAAFEKLKQPGATAKDYMELAMMLPKDDSEALRKSFETMEASQRQAALTDSAQVFSAFKAGRPDLAIALIRRQGEAERSAGNEQGALLAEEWAKMAEGSPEGAKAVETMMGYTIAQMPGGDKAIEGAVNFEKSLNEAKLFPTLMAQKQAELKKATSDADRAAIDAKYAEPIAQATAAKNKAEADKLTIELQTYPALKAQELAKATSDAERAAIEAKYADRKAAAETKLTELGVEVKTTELKTFADLKAAELKKATSDADKAAVEAKYADPIAAAQLLLTQGNAQAQQISLKTLEEAKALELSAAKTADEVAKVNAKYAEPMAAAKLLEAQGIATATGITNKTLAELKAAELSTAKSVAEKAAIEAKYADPLQAAQLLLAQGQAKAIEITNLSLADLKAQELAKAKSDAEVAAVNAKYADPQQAANLLLAQNKNSELAITLQTLAEQKKQELAKATSDAQKASIEASFAQRVNQADLDQRLASLGLTMEQTDRSKVEKAIAQAKEARAVETFPDEKARLTAQALIAQSEATIAEVNARYAEKLKIAELEKMGKDNELSDAQINRAIAEGKKVSAETSKILMEVDSLKKTGGVGADKLFDYEDRIRKEYVARTAKVASMQQTYETIKSSSVDSTGAGDVALVFGFMRMLDPDSVVRETEFATAQDTAGLVNKLKALGTKVENGQFLSQQQRGEFAALAKKYMDAALNHEKRVREDLSITVKNYGLNPANVFGVGSPNTPPAQTEPEPTVEVDF